jgi:hypothetical protein
MRAVFASQGPVLGVDWLGWLRRWKTFSPFRNQRQAAFDPVAEQLATDLLSEQLTDGARHCIAYLPAGGEAASHYLVAIGKRLKPAKLTGREAAIEPVKRTGSGAR